MARRVPFGLPQVVASGDQLAVPDDDRADGDFPFGRGRLGFRQGGPHPGLVIGLGRRQGEVRRYMHSWGSPSSSLVRNDCPQPQVRTAFGFLMENPPPISVST